MFQPIDRRTLLRGAAGALLPLPWLNAMAAPKAGSTPPLRFAALFKPNGVHPPSWNVEGGKEDDFQLSSMMAPFAGHRSDLIVVDNMGDSGFSTHHASAQRFLSGGGRASIDQLIAAKIGSETAHRSLELTTEGLFTQQPSCSYISYNMQGRPVPRESDPQLVFDRLFRDPLVDPERRRETASLLDAVGDHAKGLSRRVGREDRATLEQYLTVVRETEKRIETLDRSQKEAPRLESVERPPVARNLDEQADVLIDLMALALWSDSTRCATFMLGNDNSRMIFDFLGVKKEHHYLSHYFRNFSQPNLEDLYKICLWHMRKFNHLLDRMKSYAEGEGNLLDHSVVLFGTGMGESDGHTAQRIPTVLAGKAGGRLKTGRYMRHARNQELSRLHRTLLDLFDVPPPAGHPVARQAPLLGLDGAKFEAYAEAPFQTRAELKDGRATVQGRLRFSSDLAQANQFFIDVEGERLPVRLQVSFKTLQQHSIPYFCGEPVVVVGDGSRKGGEIVLTQVSEIKSLSGVRPGADKD